jgi:hypothetical protein
MTDAASADWLLDDLVARVPAARQAIVLSVDGLLTGKSRTLSRMDAEHLAAIAAGFAGLARTAGRHFRGGPVRQERVDETLGGEAGGEGAVPDVGLQLRGERVELAAVAQPVQELVSDQRPHPADALVAAAAVELAAVAEHPLVAFDQGPHLVQAVPGAGAATGA